MVHSQRAVAAMLTGRWQECEDQARSAIEIFRRQCTGVAWELAMVATFLFTARTLTGRWQENAAELPILLRDAEERKDLFATVNLQLLTSSYTHCFARDDVDSAKHMLEEAIGRWPDKKFDVQHLYYVLAQCELELFAGNPEKAYRAIIFKWPKIVQSGLLRLTLMEGFARATRARAALALAVSCKPGPRRSLLLREVKAQTRRIERMKAAYTPGLALLLRAGLATFSDHAKAITCLEKAEEQLGKSHLRPWLACAQLRLSRSSAEEWFKRENLNSAKMARLLLPGNWDFIKRSQENQSKWVES
jgi:hypothetical protein